MTAATVTLEADAIAAIEITMPVQDYIALPGGGYHVPYMGEQETLCVTSAAMQP